MPVAVRRLLPKDLLTHTLKFKIMDIQTTTIQQIKGEAFVCIYENDEVSDNMIFHVKPNESIVIALKQGSNYIAKDTEQEVLDEIAALKLTYTPQEVVSVEERTALQVEADRIAGWLYKDRTIRVFLKDADYVKMLLDYPELAVMRQQLNIPAEAKDGGQYLYFTELLPEHKAILEAFNGVTDTL